MTAPTFSRHCLLDGCLMEMSHRARDGAETVRCPRCGRTEEISKSGMAIPPSPTAKVAHTEERGS